MRTAVGGRPVPVPCSTSSQKASAISQDGLDDLKRASPTKLPNYSRTSATPCVSFRILAVNRGLGYNSIPHGRPLEHKHASLGSNRGIFFALGAALGARDYWGRRRYSVYGCRCHRSFLFSSRDARPDADLLWPAVHSLCRQGVGFFIVLSVYLQRAADVFGATSIGSSHAQSFFPSASSFTNFSTNASETSSAGFWPHKRPSRFSGFLPPR